MSARPTAVVIVSILALVIVLWGAVSTFGLINIGDIAPIPYALTLIAFIASIVGFWYMRWWGVVLGVVAASYVAFISFFRVVPTAQLAMLAFAVPMVVVAFLHRAQFKP